MNDRPRISVVIPTYRRRDALRRALTTLTTQDLPAGAFEVVVAIDGSDDGTRELVDTFEAPYSLRSLWQPNRGRAAACNAGVREARGEMLVFLDDDMEATSGLLAAHLGAHAGRANLGVMGAVALVCDRAWSTYVRDFAARWERKMAFVARPGHVFRMIDFVTHNFSIRREWFTRTGGFDEAFRAYGHEDRELFVRLREAGVVVSFCAAAFAHHRYHRPFAALARDSVGRGKTAVLLAQKHPSLVELDPSEMGDLLPLRGLLKGRRSPRGIRDFLLVLGERLPLIPDWIAVLTEWWEQQLPALPPPLHYYERAVEYYYWLGVRAALREASAGPTSGADLPS